MHYEGTDEHKRHSSNACRSVPFAGCVSLRLLCRSFTPPNLLLRQNRQTWRPSSPVLARAPANRLLSVPRRERGRDVSAPSATVLPHIWYREWDSQEGHKFRIVVDARDSSCPTPSVHWFSPSFRLSGSFPGRTRWCSWLGRSQRSHSVPVAAAKHLASIAITCDGWLICRGRVGLWRYSFMHVGFDARITERPPATMQPKARRTTRLGESQREIGFAVGTTTS